MPALQIRKHPDERWSVRATWPDGAFDEISGFGFEGEANHWIATKFPVWLEQQKKARSHGSAA
jgi:hypothetical protein